MPALQTLVPAGCPEDGDLSAAAARTCYSDLTEVAAGLLDRCRERLRAPGPSAGPDDRDLAQRAARDVAAALVQLGAALIRPVADRSRRIGPGPRMLARVADLAEPWDWEQPRPTDASMPADLLRAARQIRAAADLWATHHTEEGTPRSPEAARLRHPAVLGPATRQWRALVETSVEIGAALRDGPGGRATGAPQPGEGAARVREPSGSTAAETVPSVLRSVAAARPAEPDPRVEVSVARPGVRTRAGAMTELADRVDLLHRAAWSLAEAGQAPAPALANLALVGCLLAQAAGRAAGDPGRAPVGESAGWARDAAGRWAEVAGLWRSMRTAHPPLTALALHRVAISRALGTMLGADRPGRGTRGRAGADGSAAALLGLAARYCEVAEHNLRAIRATQERGELYLVGSAIPGEVLTCREDLLDVKLAGQLTPAPMFQVRRLESAYRAVSRLAQSAAVGDVVGVPGSGERLDRREAVARGLSPGLP